MNVLNDEADIIKCNLKMHRWLVVQKSRSPTVESRVDVRYGDSTTCAQKADTPKRMCELQ